MAQQAKPRHHRRPNGVPSRHRKPIEQVFERLDATHPHPASDNAPSRARSYRNPTGRTALAVFGAGLVLGLIYSISRARRSA